MILLLLALVYVPMILEARRAARHDRVLRACHAIEPAGDVYGAMAVAYPASFAAMAAEGWLRAAEIDALLATGAVVFVLAKALKYWAIATLGDRWTFRVLVPPGSTRIARGPYRLMRHPNYVAVVGELVGTALMAHAPAAGIASVAGFGALIVMRIRVEERALGGVDA